MLPDKDKIQKIVIQSPNPVGDTIMAIPLLECIRNNFPHANIILSIRDSIRDILEDSPYIDEIVSIKDDKSVLGMLKLASRIREYSSDMGILLPNSIRSFLVFKLAGIKNIIGYRRNIRKFFINGPTPIYEAGKIKPIPMQQYYLEICKYLGLKLPDKPKPSLFFSEKISEQADKLLKKYGINDSDFVIGINPGARFGSSKCWPADNFAKLAELVQNRFNAKILLFTAPNEAEIADYIVKNTKAHLINTNKDLNLAILKPLVKRCGLLITNDTGPRHYAVAFDVPVVVIMGAVNPVFTNSNLDKTVIIRKNLPCSPCHLKTCPRNHECMTLITPQEVLSACEQILQKQRP